MKKAFEKHESLYSILSIVVYLVVNSYLAQNYTVNHHISAIALSLMSLLVILLIISIERLEFYGLKKPENVKQLLYFIPLIIFGTQGFWSGINRQLSPYEICFHIISMINVGFLEEIIFRGFLFREMAKDNLKAAIIVTSRTFGIDHIINLLNGAELIPTLFQIGYAISLGYCFVTVLIKSKSLIPCIVCHMMINLFSIFNVDNNITNYITPTLLMIFPLCYTIYINKTIKE